MNDYKIANMIEKIEVTETFIKTEYADGRISQRTANELLRLTRETKEIGINN
jgi:hypothetical protein